MSAVVKRSITLHGQKTSVTLEDEFWNAFREIARRDKTTVASLMAQINYSENEGNLSSAVRVFVLKQFMTLVDQRWAAADGARPGAGTGAAFQPTPPTQPVSFPSAASQRGVQPLTGNAPAGGSLGGGGGSLSSSPSGSSPMSPLLAHSGHCFVQCQCLLSEVKRT